MQHLLITIIFTFTTFALSASSPMVPEINQENLKKYSESATIVKASIISFESTIEKDGITVSYTKDQLQKLKNECYASDKIYDTEYYSLRRVYSIALKIEESYRGNLKNGTFKIITVSDHIDSRCPHHGAYPGFFSSKPTLVWMFYEKKSKERTEFLHKVSSLENYNKLIKMDNKSQ